MEFHQDNDFFPCWGSESSRVVLHQENMEGDKPVKSQSDTATIVTTDLRAGPLSWWKRTPFNSSVYQAVHERSRVLLFKVINYLSSVGLYGRKQMQFVSGKGELNAYQVSLLWHNSLVSLCAFQHTLVSSELKGVVTKPILGLGIIQSIHVWHL